MGEVNKGNLRQAEREAREWFVLLQSDAVSDAQKREYEAWLSAHSQNRAAIRQLEEVSELLITLSRSPEGARLRRSVESPSANRWYQRLWFPTASWSSFPGRMLGAMAAVVVVSVAVGTLWLQNSQQADPILRYTTTTAEVRTVQLGDGSKVTLGAQTELLVAFDADTRRSTLLAGEAFFDVRSDAERPFFVDVNDMQVKVVGTQFDVRKRYAGTSVAVLEGKVQVAADNDSMRLLLNAGEQVSKLQNAGFSDVGSVSAVELGAWRNGRLVFRNTPLIDVITDANRYFDGSMSLEVPDIQDEKVTLTLRTDQIEQLPDMLDAALPIDVRRSSDGQITLVPASDNNP